MREILFRGKRTINGNWVEGYLVKLGRESFSDPERYGICNKAIPLGGSGVCYNLRIDEVIQETVGQYTGLTDKNGTRIFEGDIVTAYFKNNRCKQTFKVSFLDGMFIFDNGFVKVNLWDIFSIEVIGNIYDNPELVEDKQ